MDKVVWKRKERIAAPDLRSFKNNRNSNSSSISNNIRAVFKNKIFIRITSGIILILILILTFNIISSEAFNIQDVNIYGVKQLSISELESKSEVIKGQNLFSVDTDKIRSDLNSSSIFLKDIYVEKVFPDRIDIFVVERFPVAVIVNFKGAYLVDEDDIVVKTLSLTDGLSISQDEIRILGDEMQINDKYIEETLRKELPEEQRDSFKIEDVSDEEKQNFITRKKTELLQKIEVNFELNSKGVNTTEFANLDRVFIYSNDNYEIGTEINTKYIRESRDVISFFSSFESYTLSKLVWTNKFTFEVATVDGRYFIFTDRRDVYDQVQDLKRMVQYLDERDETFSVIDVSAGVVSVR